MRIGLFRSVVTLACCGQAVVASAQAPAREAFDVVSVRRNTSGTTQQSIAPQATGVSFINVQLRAIIQLAYGIPQPARLVGLPAWVNDRYDIIAKTDTPIQPATMIAMRPKLQALLADRFKLSAKVEQRELDAYALVLARRDGQLGPNLKVSTVTCAGRGAPGAPAADTPTPAPGAPAPVPCGPRTGGAGKFVFVGSPLSLFASVLSLAVGRSVVDRTGLTGLYDFEVTFAPEGGPAPALATTENASLFTALQEQLGLKLDPEKERVDVLVVDRIEQASEN